DLERALITMEEKGFVGCNVTLPHKTSIVPLLYEIDDAAQKIGAVNTVIFKDGKRLGKNTDAFGFIENLKNTHIITHKNKAVILGAGGAARAVCKALLDEGFAEIMLCNRSQDKAADIAEQLGGNIDIGEWEKRSSILEGADLLVNTTSLGMQGKTPLDIELSALPEHAIVNDIVYKPLETELLKKARTHHLKTVDGLGMLIYQAVPAFEAWFGIRPTPDAQLRELLETKL